VNPAAVRLPTRVLAAELLLGVSLFGALIAFAPQFLLLDDRIARATVTFAGWMLVPLAALSYVMTRMRLRKSRFVLRSLALGSATLDPDDIARLSSVPAHVTLMFVTIVSAAVAVFLLAPFRPALLDFETALSLSLLGLIILATAALPLYIAVRAAVARVLELANPDSMQGLLHQAEASAKARRRLVWRLLLATTTPVGLIAVGSALIAHAHIRNFDAESRVSTAEIVAKVALEASPGAVAQAGRVEAIEAAKNLGFVLGLERAGATFALERDDGGRVSLTTPLDEGAANIRFEMTAIPAITLADIGIALIAMGLAAALGLAVGRTLSTDLSQATVRVRLLGTEGVLRGEDPAPAPARYAQVFALNRAIDTLAARFRVFARAQERAIEARDAARKLRSLLFASVSHDLKSPLNSILGFAAIVRQKPLSAAQRESLGFIEQSGRELLALIETILDVAKIEAGKMTLTRSEMSIAVVVAEAVRRARLLAAARPLEFEIDVADGLPRVTGDESRLTQALSALIWYSARSGEPLSPEGTVRTVQLKAKPSAGPKGEPRVLIEIEAPKGPIPPDELASLLSSATGLSSETGAAGRRRYSGLTLGLGLARSLVELHGGSLTVKGTTRGTPVFDVSLPAA
jgi:signal transduction histidine kinase